jgi:hypothetical protein
MYLHFAGHEVKKLGEVDGSISVSIDFVNHVLELRLGGVLTQGPHDCPEFLSGDATCPLTHQSQIYMSTKTPNIKIRNKITERKRKTKPRAEEVSSYHHHPCRTN